MNDRFQSCGKEVLRDGKHFADCLSPEDAEALAVLLNHIIRPAVGIEDDVLMWAGERLCPAR